MEKTIKVTQSGNLEQVAKVTQLRIFLTGVSCVGKTTIGGKIAEFLGIKFFDLDQEIETFFGTSIERLHNRFLTVYSFREEAAKALAHLLNRTESRTCVVALPPSGLMGGYLRVLKKTNGTIVALDDRPENILERIRFYDIDSRPMEKKLTAKEKKLYLREIKKDITYFRKSYQRANLQVDIAGLNPEQAAWKVIQDAILVN
jgi:shikimate kinase